jgi:hypothetical protein
VRCWNSRLSTRAATVLNISSRFFLSVMTLS